jgi:3-hydroxyisobutyrate dehydrogenase-like beta-hydroxyacid dehydrogenase
MNKAGIIGLGIVGSRVAKNLRQAGIHTYVWSRSPKAEPNFLGSARDVAKLAPLVQIFVRNGQDLLEVVRSMLPALTPDHIIANCATVDLDSTLQAAELVAEAGAAFLDCPFTGSKDAAENGQLNYYVGGDMEVILRAQPLLEHSAANIIPVGAIGHATIVKIATNMVTATTIQVLSEALAVSIAHGVEPQTFQAAVENNACNSKVTGMKLPAMIAGDYEPHFSLNNMFKDSQFALTLAKQAGLDIPALATTAGAMFQTIKAGHGEEDFCSIFSRFASHES